MHDQLRLWGLSRRPTLVIFDLDGTLADSLEDLTASINFMRTEFGLPAMTQEEVRRCIGKGARNLVIKCLPEDDTRIDQALACFLAHNGSNLAVHSRSYPGVSELLAALRFAGIPLALVSNKNSAHCELLLSTLGIAEYFPIILGGDAVTSCKPSPVPLREAIHRAAAEAQSTIMIGDSINDFEAAQTAGVRSIGCNFGFGEQWELERATVRIDSLTELLPLPWQ